MFFYKIFSLNNFSLFISINVNYCRNDRFFCFHIGSCFRDKIIVKIKRSPPCNLSLFISTNMNYFKNNRIVTPDRALRVWNYREVKRSSLFAPPPPSCPENSLWILWQGELRRSLSELISRRAKSLNLATFEFCELNREPIHIHRVVNLRSRLHQPLFLPFERVGEVVECKKRIRRITHTHTHRSVHSSTPDSR